MRSKLTRLEKIGASHADRTLCLLCPSLMDTEVSLMTKELRFVLM